MPLYEYQCDACGEVFEKLQKFSDKPLTVHENCGGAVRRLLTAPFFQFKGTGWYVTDYGHGKSVSNGSNGSHASNGSNGNGRNHETKSESTVKTGSSPASTGTTAPSAAK